jgi:CorA-like Mg2+ transporter protein
LNVRGYSTYCKTQDSTRATACCSTQAISSSASSKKPRRATIITGIYGMNFRHMPELDWVFGYPMAITIMIVSVIMLRRYFKHVGWLG